MKRTAIIFVFGALVTVIFGCFRPEPLRGDLRGRNHWLSESEIDTRPAMNLEINKPYRLEFGRGSGWHGLDTILINESGLVVLHRLKMEQEKDVIHHYWETATFSIDRDMLSQIAILIQDLRIPEMKKAYHANVHDGTQWVFWLVQGGQEKSIYFNNHFPEAIQDFAVALDSKLKGAGMEKVQWTRVPNEKSRQHEKAIWNSIKNKPSKE